MMDLLKYDELEYVFLYLDIQDISRLSCVSIKFFNHVGTFYERKGSKFLLRDSLLLHFETELLIEDEKETLKILQGNDYSYRWLFVNWLKLRNLRRASVTKFHMPHLGNHRYIRRENDKSLHRDVVYLKQVCWLHFSYTFHVFPGTYRTILRMECSQAHWPSSSEPAIIRVYWQDRDGPHEVRTQVTTKQWKQIHKGLVKGENVNINGVAISNFDTDTGWFDFALPNFRLSETTDVTFEFRDVKNLYWKSDMRWDYVELNQIDWKTLPLKESLVV